MNRKQLKITALFLLSLCAVVVVYAGTVGVNDLFGFTTGYGFTDLNSTNVNAGTEFYRGGENYTQLIEILIPNHDQDVNTTDTVTFANVNATTEYYRGPFNYTAWLLAKAGVVIPINATPIGCTYYIDRDGADSRMWNGLTGELLGSDSANNIWNWTIGNITIPGRIGGKILFNGTHEVTGAGASSLYIDSMRESNAAIWIQGLGRDTSILRRTNAGDLFWLYNETNIKFSDFTAETEDGTVFYGWDRGVTLLAQPSVVFSRWRDLDINCGDTQSDSGWAIHLQTSEQCDIESVEILSYGDGAVRFQNRNTQFAYGNTEITGDNMWWIYSNNSIGLYLQGTASKSVENIHVAGRIAILGRTPFAGAFDNNITGVWFHEASNNQIMSVKSERTRTFCMFTGSCLNNLVDSQYRFATTMDKLTAVNWTSGSTGNVFMRYNIGLNGLNVFFNDTGSSLNNPNIIKDNIYRGHLAGNIVMNINDNTIVSGISGFTNNLGEYAQGQQIQSDTFPNAATEYEVQHRLAREPSYVGIMWEESVVENHWITMNATHFVIHLVDASEQAYTFTYYITINGKFGGP